MKELVKYIVDRFAENPDKVRIEETEEGGTTVITVTLCADDMGKVIGRQGKIAKALRILVKAMGQKENKRYSVEIKEEGGR